MKKIKYIGYIILFALVIISGCSKSNTIDISFDDYHLTLTTTQTYQQTGESIKNTDNIYKMYISPNQSGFTNSILISKNTYDIQIPLEKLVQVNIQKPENKLKGFKSQSSIIKFKCKNISSTGYLEAVTLDSTNINKTLYINQLFFIDDGWLYIISSSTENNNENKAFKKALKTITCETSQTSK